MKAMHKITSAGQGVLDSLERQESGTVVISSPSPVLKPHPPMSQRSIVDELTQLVALRDQGVLTDLEFSAMKGKLIS